MKSIKNIRTDYLKNELNFDDLTAHPFNLFKSWMSDALEQVIEPNAFVLSTVNAWTIKALFFSQIITVRNHKILKVTPLFA